MTSIAAVEGIALEAPLPSNMLPPISIPHAEKLSPIVFGAYRACLVKVTTDTGETGYGECMVRLAPRATVEIVNDIGRALVGMDPLDTSPAWELMFSLMMNRGHLRGFFNEAMSGIDIALWDLKGKLLGQPIYALLGGKHRDQIDCYASSLRFRTLDYTAEDAKSLAAEGYQGLKVKIGKDRYNANQDLRLLETVRSAVGDDVWLAADANCGYDLPTALKVSKCLADLGYEWFEEPLPSDDWNGYAMLTSRGEIAIAGGETEFTKYGFRELFERKTLNIVQPNVSRCGGFTEAMKIAAMAECYHIRYAPHTGSCGGLTLAAELHLSAVLPNFLTYEHMRRDWSRDHENPFRSQLVHGAVERFRDGYLELPSGPGLGVVVDEDLVARYRIL